MATPTTPVKKGGATYHPDGTIEFGGERNTLNRWAELFGKNRSTLGHRLARGMSFYDAITKPSANPGPGRHPADEDVMAPPQEDKPVSDVVVQPPHYTKWVVEPITFIMKNGMEMWRGNVIKYVSRAGSKTYDGMDEIQSEITDLRKAMRYCEMRINQLEGREVL